MLALAILLAAADPTRVLVLDLANSGVSADEARVVVTAMPRRPPAPTPR